MLEVDPRNWLKKLREDGVSCANGARPVPVRGSLSGLVEALVVKTSVADRTPLAEGVKVTLTMQFVPCARDAPHVLDEIEKSAEFVPLRAMLVIVNVAVPVFVRVTLFAPEVVPTF